MLIILRNKSYGQIMATHFSKLPISRFSTYIRKALTAFLMYVVTYKWKLSKMGYFQHSEWSDGAMYCGSKVRYFLLRT